MYERKDQVVALLERLAAAFIQNEASHDPLVTVTKVTVSKDLKRTTVYVTTLPENGEERALAFLKRKGTDFRNHLKKHSKLKFIPHVEFEIDRGERHRQQIDEIAQEIKKKDSNEH